MDYLPSTLCCHPFLSLMIKPDTIQHICIIGAGPAGLAALQVIMETEEFKAGLWKPTAFEARGGVGGVWVPASPTDDPPLTPLYDSLTTNLPHPVMAYESFSFPPSTPLFPRAAVVHRYLEDYASHYNLTGNIRLNTRVDHVRRGSVPQKWLVTLSTKEELEFDYIVVANGHYRVPRLPDSPGLKSWLDSGRASHSAWYRHPHDLGDVVLVVGAGPSGQDISAEMRTVSKTVIHSMTGVTPEDIGNLKRRGRVTEFKDGGEVVFQDGTREFGIDHCILATGYEMSFPFLSSEMDLEIPPPIPPLPSRLFNTTFSVFPLAKHIFPLQSDYPSTSVAFLGLPIRVAPLPLVEAQARAAVKVFRDPKSLDATQEAVEIVSRYQELSSEYFGDEVAIYKAWHRLPNHQQFDYRDRLHEFAGVDRKVAEWAKEMYDRKDVLRSEWRELERIGEAEQWVQGVGENGLWEWIEMMRRLIRRADDRQGQKTKL
ncbi:hypothetical protein JAAARDRAFT_34591 [Jaapia argillacea MUCL 33604]|uniref:FAD/NAD(P)-binding domain-containing protein n=1 Tax=Jaapia argillacea MUCL 33604 TaxID=933084 RepID=A0A067PV83_9AGAM|nr:hypothetical protein JAAARDRAFT_34591 [Jaapia argillacea MUCL 33604]